MFELLILFMFFISRMYYIKDSRIIIITVYFSTSLADIVAPYRYYPLTNFSPIHHYSSV